MTIRRAMATLSELQALVMTYEAIVASRGEPGCPQSYRRALREAQCFAKAVRSILERGPDPLPSLQILAEMRK